MDKESTNSMMNSFKGNWPCMPYCCMRRIPERITAGGRPVRKTSLLFAIVAGIIAILVLSGLLFFDLLNYSSWF